MRLERAAKAMYEARRFRQVDDMGSPITWDGLAEFQREDCINQAKACLDSVRRLQPSTPTDVTPA